MALAVAASDTGRNSPWGWRGQRAAESKHMGAAVILKRLKEMGIVEIT
jgi:hypothetical protein